MFYKLDENKNIIKCTAEETSKQREHMHKTNTKHVGDDTINDLHISTVWIGIDHAYDLLDKHIENYKPILFETMIFNKKDYPYECYVDRYSTWQEAEEGHKKAIQWVIDGCKDES